MDYENQQMIERLFNGKQAGPLTEQALLSRPQVVEQLQRCAQEQNLSERFLLQLLVCMAQHKRTTVNTLVGILRHHFAYKGDTLASMQACTDAIEQAVLYGLVTVELETMRLVVVHDLTEQQQALVRQYQYLPPMTVPPRTIRNDRVNRGSGYLTITTDSLILKDKHNHHQGDLCVDSLNRFNQVPVSINEYVVKAIRNNWSNLDRQKEGETWENYRKRVQAFERYEQDSFLTMALLIEMGNTFYFTHKVDKRGRTYCSGYHTSYQGNDWNKAVLEFANKEILEETIQ